MVNNSYSIRSRIQAKYDCLDHLIKGKPCPYDCLDCELNYMQGTLGEQRSDLLVILAILDNCDIVSFS